MPEISKTENVKEQYTDDKNLSVRLKLHQKYSTNPYAFPDWLFDQYKLTEGCKILELGCGNGQFWENRINKLPAKSTIILSDLSDGMLDIVQKKYSGFMNVSVRKIDIQEIPFPEGSFDIIIANFMLYHVPDISKGLSEVKRVLKPGGIFYAATNSSRGMREYLHNAFFDFNKNLDVFGGDRFPFSSENGGNILKNHFSNVKLLEHIDSLEISETQDLIDWIESTISIASYSKNDTAGLYDYFEKIRIAEGTIKIPKRTGLFVSYK
ncbi:MAG: class I SAM-dependent methyltransferase [Saccharofermentanales bacterium]